MKELISIQIYIENIIRQSLEASFPNYNFTDIPIVLQTEYDKARGDYSTNIAMQSSKVLRKNPREVATTLIDDILSRNGDYFNRIEIAGPGFINFFLKQTLLTEWLSKYLVDVNRFKQTFGSGKRVIVEFVSANPTGPLHIGHGRGAAVGDSIANIMEAAGYDVHREYYVNDAGVQMKMLGSSVFAKYSELVGGSYIIQGDGYKGEYISSIADKIAKKYGNKLLSLSVDDAISFSGVFASKLILYGMYECENNDIISMDGSIHETLERFNVTIDEYFSEKSVYDKHEIDDTLKKLKDVDAVYDKDNALWLNTIAKGDEKDRVLRKTDGSYTYLMPDLAYHNNKLMRNFDIMIDLWGSDHHGYVKRVEAGISYLGHDVSKFKVIILQMVNLMRSGEKAKMSTRAGEFVTLDWLLDEVGTDAARFFYNLRSPNSQLEFDIDLAKSQSSNNPVYYVQYCHARICSLFSGAMTKGIKFEKNMNIDLLVSDIELNIIKKMADYGHIIIASSENSEPHRVAYYLMELASLFHTYYNSESILDNVYELTNARLNLCNLVREVIKHGLELLGVSAPEKM